MNSQLQDYARAKLKEDLALCSEGQQLLFKRMYSGKKTIEEIKATDINTVIDNMSEEKLDWAMTQVSNTLKKKGI